MKYHSTEVDTYITMSSQNSNPSTRRLEDIPSVKIHKTNSFESSYEKWTDSVQRVAALKKKHESLHSDIVDLDNVRINRLLNAEASRNGYDVFSDQELETLKNYFIEIDKMYERHVKEQMDVEHHYNIATKKMRRNDGTAGITGVVLVAPFEVPNGKTLQRQNAFIGNPTMPKTQSAQPQQPEQIRRNVQTHTKAAIVIDDEQRGTKRKADEMDK